MSTLTVIAQYPSEAEQLLITSESFRAMHRRAQAAESRVKKLEDELFIANCNVRSARSFARAELAPSLTREEGIALLNRYAACARDWYSSQKHQLALDEATESCLRQMGIK